MEERKKIFERESKFRKERQQNIEEGKKESKTDGRKKRTYSTVNCTVNIEQEQHRFKSDILYNKMKVFIFDRNKCENKALPVH